VHLRRYLHEEEVCAMKVIPVTLPGIVS